MKIAHCCLANFYNDNYEYQENILPRMHKLQGHDVIIIASTEVFVDKLRLGYQAANNYINEDGIPVHRLPYKRYIPARLVHKLRLYDGLYNELCQFKPDLIFLHDAQFLSVSAVVKYIKEHPDVKINVDGHSDFGNSARGFISRRILHGIIYKYCMKRIEPYVSHFFGTLPNRVDFFREVYDLPEKKLKLLTMGADDEKVKYARESNQRDEIRRKFGIADDAFLIVSGGKFSKDKHDILKVMDAVHLLSKTTDVRLLIFGSLSDEEDFKAKFNDKCDGRIVIYAGWIKGKESYNYFEASDLVMFAGYHSVLWEQAAGQGKPCLVRYITGQTHIDHGGNCLFIRNFTTADIQSLIKEAINNYKSISKVASESAHYFSYNEIAKRALE